jgi:hypothetical protein
MSMRHTLREGLNPVKNHADNFPLLPGTTQINMAYINKAILVIWDAQLQVHGFVLVFIGSLVGSFGDLALKIVFAGHFA